MILLHPLRVAEASAFFFHPNCLHRWSSQCLVNDVCVVYNVAALQFPDFSSKILNFGNSGSLALLLRLYSLYLFYAGFQFAEDPSSAYLASFFQPTPDPPFPISFLFTHGISLPWQYPQWPYPFVLCLWSTLPALNFDLASSPLLPSGCQSCLRKSLCK